MIDFEQFDGVAANPREIAVIGAGYVGLPTALLLAHVGHHVKLAERDESRRAALAAGTSPFREDDLEPLLAQCLREGRLTMVADAAAAAASADFVILCVNTPQGPDGRADLGDVDAAVEQIRDHLRDDAIVVIKATVPVGTAERVAKLIGRPAVCVVANPEFLRESKVIFDTFFPQRIVVGGANHDAVRAVGDLFAVTATPTVETDARTAELTKYAANAFLALKLSFINSVAELCDAVGADVGAIVDAMGRDPRIGAGQLGVGPGWGGPCLPKDVHALIQIAAEAGVPVPLVTATVVANVRQRDHVVDRVRQLAGGDLDGRRVAVLGLTFKAETEDRRNSPAVAVAQQLRACGARVAAFDPTVDGSAVSDDLAGLRVARSATDAATDAAVVVVLTEWASFADLDWAALAGVVGQRVVLDTRSIVDGAAVIAAGFALHRLGRA